MTPPSSLSPSSTAAAVAASADNSNHHDNHDIDSEGGSSSTRAPKRLKVSSESTTASAAPTPEDPIASAFRPGAISPSSARALRAQYLASTPYRHALLPALFTPSLLRSARQECLTHLHATHKETDIYRVLQTGDLANLDGLPAAEARLLPSLRRLRDALYSRTFRRFVERVCGLKRGSLSATKRDLSHNRYAKGCHLLCHDDVIGSRAVSYIVYLVEEEEDGDGGTGPRGWTAADGGALELYPVVSRGTPAVRPEKVVVPRWNEVAMFAVQPGLSFHAVSEVLAVKEGRERPSISGWFHFRQPEDELVEPLGEGEEGEDWEEEGAAEGLEENTAEASLEQLMADDGRPFAALPPLSFRGGPDSSSSSDDSIPDDADDAPLTPSEVATLAEFVNPTYLSAPTIASLNARFVAESAVQLREFLRAELAAAVRAATRAADAADGLGWRDSDDVGMSRQPPPPDYAAGVRGGWVERGPAHKQRFLELDEGDSGKRDGDKQDAAAALLLRVQRELVPSAAFRRFLYLVTSVKPMGVRTRTARFRPGMDYTLATPTPGFPSSSSSSSSTEEEEEEPPLGVLDATLCFVRDDSAGAARVWASDDVGGFECYMAADEGNDDPAQYRGAADDGGYGKASGKNNTGDGGALLSVSASSNALSLALREPGVLKFVKYVGAAAPGSRWEVAAEYQYEF
ncbi:Oxoglutarate and iron-dependent oxygenase degradation C-term-domain-containing protein [Zopfochytrium polystomum]|nr:Oxoglutarate and iron-dependent oxygenase degradation C-term-domain-containing protein [Zopfochytrium polystomum]